MLHIFFADGCDYANVMIFLIDIKTQKIKDLPQLMLKHFYDALLRLSRFKFVSYYDNQYILTASVRTPNVGMAECHSGRNGVPSNTQSKQNQNISI